MAILCLVTLGCLRRGQRYSDFITPTPLAKEDHLVLGILGGREPWNNKKLWVRRLALDLRARSLPHVQVETLENTKRPLAVQLIRKGLDHNGDGQLSAAERESARIIIYGLSFGGAAVVKLARQLDDLDIPVLLTVQVDSVGLGDAVIPPNVRQAANFYQPNGWFIKGEPEIRAEDPGKTKILGNFKYDYSQKEVDTSHIHWFKKLFRAAHAKISNDRDVWAQVERIILNAMHTNRTDGPLRPSAQLNRSTAQRFRAFRPLPRRGHRSAPTAGSRGL